MTVPEWKRVAVLTAALAACDSRKLVPEDETDRVISAQELNRNVDVLVVVTTSAGMAEEQEALAAAYPLLLDELSAIDGGLPDLHVGVVAGDGTALWTTPRTGDCPVPAGPFIEDLLPPSGDRLTNYPAGASLAEVAACITPAVTTGATEQQPLEAMRLALASPGFRRPGAWLLIVLVADEDDHSAQPLAQYQELLLGAVAPPTGVAVGGLLGPPAARLRALADPDGIEDAVTVGAAADMPAAVTRTGASMADNIAGLCLDGCLLDTEPDLSGLQADCAVFDTQLQEVPECTATGEVDCWELAAQERCGGQTGLALRLRGSGNPVRADCRVRTECTPFKSFYDCSAGGGGAAWWPVVLAALLAIRGRRGRASVMLVALLAAAPAACDSRRVDVSDETDTEMLSQFGFHSVDLLVVVATSAGMAEEQDALADAYDEALAELDIQPELVGLHIGIVSADLGAGRDDVPGCTRDGDGAQLLAAPRDEGCPVPSDPYISDVDALAAGEDRETNYPAGATLVQVAKCITPRKTDGCAYQQPLEAMKRALEDDTGFRRDYADLAVLIVADEDDCSAVDPAALFDPALGPVDRHRCVAAKDDEDRIHPLDRYRQFFADIVLFDKVVIGGVSGPAGPVDVVEVDGHPTLAPVCSGTGGDTGPSPRLAEYLEPDRHPGAVLGCTTELDDANDALGASMSETARELAVEAGAECLSDCPLDLRSDLPGIQPECTVVDIDGVEIPPCSPGGPRECWELAEGVTCDDGFESGYQVQVHNDVFDRAECRVRTENCAPTRSLYDCSSGGGGAAAAWAAAIALVLALGSRCRRRRV